MYTVYLVCVFSICMSAVVSMPMESPDNYVPDSSLNGAETTESSTIDLAGSATVPTDTKVGCIDNGTLYNVGETINDNGNERSYCGEDGTIHYGSSNIKGGTEPQQNQTKPQSPETPVQEQPQSPPTTEQYSEVDVTESPSAPEVNAESRQASKENHVPEPGKQTPAPELESSADIPEQNNPVSEQQPSPPTTKKYPEAEESTNESNNEQEQEQPSNIPEPTISPEKEPEKASAPNVKPADTTHEQMSEANYSESTVEPEQPNNPLPNKPKTTPAVNTAIYPDNSDGCIYEGKHYALDEVILDTGTSGIFCTEYGILTFGSG